ncbi:MAG TPA: BON domain-containing protein [Bryobacteraceae bacterium]|jgi:hyperosmotically inducible protein
MNKKLLRNLALAAGISVAAAAAGTPAPATGTDSELAAKVSHEIRMYPRYSIWDNINIRVANGNVDLLGQVSQPYKKADLQRLVDRIPGVNSVNNDLTVLPLSPMDDQLRVQVARAIYRDVVLSRYAMQPVPPIHVIVDNGRVTLEGIVNTEMEKNVAGLRASGAGLSFGSVVNNLRVESPAKHS